MTKLSDSIKTAADTAKDQLSSAKTKAGEKSQAAMRSASEAFDKSKSAAARGVRSSKKIATKAVEKSSDTIDKNPIAMVLGGLAIGVIVGALLPKSEREKKILGKTGKKLNDKAKAVAGAAKNAGKEKIDSLGINSESARDQFHDLVGKATEAVKAAGKAASDAARKSD
jgi:ElaB/YqjD/DUF883 family membrane-anchored ribosome-binding protein